MSFPSGNVLLAPVRVEALVIGGGASRWGHWADTSPDYAALLRDYAFGPELMRDPIDGEVASLHPEGVHLHFHLPSALAQGRQDDETELTFDAAPNRWLVQRIAHGPDPEVPARLDAWLVLGDVEDPEGVAWPVETTGPALRVLRIGGREDVFRIDEETEKRVLTDAALAARDAVSRPAPVPLTAVGPGDPLFAAGYTACRRSFGFHDPAPCPDDLKGGDLRLSYVVAGWYDDPKQDPLARFEAARGQTPEARRRAFLDWLAAGDAYWTGAGTREIPGRVLCHGAVHGLDWQDGAEGNDTGGGHALARIQSGKHHIALGSTPHEALSALFGKSEQSEELLTALQEGLIEEDVTLKKLRTELHTRRFHKRPGGTVYAFKPLAYENKPSEASLPPEAAPSRVPPDLAVRLAALNAKVSAIDRMERALAARRKEVFHLWTDWTRKAMVTGYTETGPTGAAQSAYDAAAALLTSELEALGTERGQATIALGYPGPVATPPEGGDPVADSPLGLAGKAAGFELVAAEAAPFWTPAEPAVAISGPLMSPMNGAPAHGPEEWRHEDQVLGGWTLKPARGPEGAVTGAALRDDVLGSDAAPEFAPLATRLLDEALLFDRGLVARMARLSGLRDSDAAESLLSDALDDAARRRPPPPDPEEEALASAGADEGGEADLTGLAPASPPVPDKGSGPSLGIPPDPAAVANGGNGWSPLLLAWRAAWHPADLSGPVDAGWQIGPDGALAPKTEDSRNAVPHETEIRQTAVLSASFAANVDSRIGRLTSLLGGEVAMHWLREDLAERPVRAQMLDGFAKALGGVQSVLRLPPFDLDLAPGPDDDGPALFPFDPVHKLLDWTQAPLHQDTEPPRPAHAIRAGALELRQVRIIDGFGRSVGLPVAVATKPRADNAVLVQAAAPVVAAPASGTETQRAHFSPGFVQPMRLAFELDPGRDAGSPLAGWIVPNHLEASLVLYTASGRAVGALQRQGNGGYLWDDTPARIEAQGTTAPEATDADLLRFRDWVIDPATHECRLGSAECNYLTELINRTAARIDRAVPDEDRAASILTGRPIALVRLRLELQSDGPLIGAVPEGWPVRLGDALDREDGLIGVFAHDAPVLMPAWNPLGPDHPEVPGNFGEQALKIGMDAPLSLLALMDPEAHIHAVTGFLPRGTLSLPEPESLGARLPVASIFQVAPVIGTGDAVAMPRPSGDYGEWSWAWYAPDVGDFRLEDEIAEASTWAVRSEAERQLSEGWLRLVARPVRIRAFAADPGGSGPGRVRLRWTVEHAERIRIVNADAPEDTPPLAEFAGYLPEQCDLDTGGGVTRLALWAEGAGQWVRRDITLNGN
ncbi:hypothetical protein GQ651_15190 [Alphaproteobacteria bacterium GH1-50]|uniref:Uncharacterized protein n=1 Tax=Kangsaoukella pontilimi TaxID=2691042 RepID=A0A7C9IQH9_9RHOB|nr:hypothetical protein [Kangsaoukella pontilimi]MXQ09190.1 hypothetical protein [Kangsaoukella pontilimi]